MDKIAIIGGTGVYDPAMLHNIKEKHLMTPYGEVSFVEGEYAGKEVVFMARHGAAHSIPPHLINYRANIWALKKIGAKAIISTTAVGSLNPNFGPGHFVLVDQFLDFTKRRISSFYNGGADGVVHVDVTNPYCPHLRQLIEAKGQELHLPIHNGGVYVCTEGPRFETPAEIKMFEKLGGDLVGMTNVPEVTLAAEAEICYATISMVTNYAAGIADANLTHGEVLVEMKKNTKHLQELLLHTIEDLTFSYTDCHCRDVLKEYGGFKLEMSQR